LWFAYCRHFVIAVRGRRPRAERGLAGRSARWEQHTQAVSANLRLRYNYRPDSDLFIIYNVGTQFVSLAAANPQQIRETRFAVKFTYSFHP
jgi:hypothetical protein